MNAAHSHHTTTPSSAVDTKSTWRWYHGVLFYYGTDALVEPNARWVKPRKGKE
jgi:hypothetical protein